MRKERKDILESINVIVAERMSYVVDYVQSFHLDDTCRKDILPVYTPDSKYCLLKLGEFLGTFMLLFLILIVFTFVIIEKRVGKSFKRTTNALWLLI
jgi:hypothetical protein